jgi:hypothetical protein
MRHRQQALFGVLLLTFVPVHGAEDSRQKEIRELKAHLVKCAQMGEAALAVAPEARRGMPDSYQEELIIRKAPRDLLLEAIDQAIRTGTTEERAGAFGIYAGLIYDGKEKPNKEYLTIFLDCIRTDDLRSLAFTFMLVNVLHWYPSRETVLAFVELSKRSSNFELRDTALSRAAEMMGMYIGVYKNATPEQNEKALSDFVSWVDKNADRIQFNSKGKFRLAHGGTSTDHDVLDAKDRERIRKDPVGVVRLFRQITDDDDDSNADLNGDAAVGLLGPEGAALMAKREAMAKEEREPGSEMDARLGSYADSYPVQDAALLAAVYVVAYEKDPEGLRMAKEILIEASRSDVERVAAKEPRWVRKKAEALANDASEGD